MESATSQGSDILLSGILDTQFDVGVLGFSSGILAACVVASSATTLSYITRAVEIYKVALWIGIRVQLHRVRMMAGNRMLGTHLPWSIVLVGIGKQDAEILLISFNEKVRVAALELISYSANHLRPAKQVSPVFDCYSER
jgi:hypothetical protein